MPGAGFRRESWIGPNLIPRTSDRRPRLVHASDTGVLRKQWPRSDSVLLQYHLIPFLQPAQHLGLGAIRDANIDRDLVLALLAFGVGNLDGGFLVLVVE